MLQNHRKGINFSPNNQKKTQKKNTNLMLFLDLDCLLQVCLSYISVNVATFLIQPAWIVQNTRMNFVINSSKDWPINQILAYL